MTAPRRPHTLLRVVGWMRDSWLVFGIALAILLGAEVALRLQSALRADAQRHGHPGHPYADSVWFEQYLAEDAASRGLAWRPYVYFRRQPFTGTYINVDSAGVRRTVQAVSGPDPRHVFLFGGSTMFGSFQRDGATIPSLMAAQLADLGIVDVHLTNFGETGYVFTQSVLELLLQLRNGARPDVVLFYDGINDVFSTVQNEAAGIPQNERNRAREFDLGRAVFAWERDLATEVRAWARIAELGAMRLRLLSRPRARLRLDQAVGLDIEAAAADLATVYGVTARFVEALGAEFGFVPLYVWQPNPYTTTKPLTVLEQEFARQVEADPFRRQVGSVHAAVPGVLESTMADIAPGRFLNLGHLFDGYERPAFVDVVGHVTEEANERIVAAMVPAVAALLHGDE